MNDDEKGNHKHVIKLSFILSLYLHGYYGNPSYRNYIVSCNLNCTRRIVLETRVVTDVNDV